METPRHIHFIGIGGIGISALAQMMVGQGHTVTGVNDSESPQTLDRLRSMGVSISTDRSVDQIPDADWYVYSTAWDVNERLYMDAVRKKGKPVYNYFEALGQATQQKDIVAVSGTNGKTTTTAMIAHGLLVTGHNPSVVVGSIMNLPDGTRTNFHQGGSDQPFIVEACEYQRHFLELSPHVLVITNIEADHLDYYKDIDDIISAFRELAEKVPVNGAIIYNGKDPHVMTALHGITARCIDWTTTEVVDGLKIPGDHNRANAQAACAVLEYFGVPHNTAQEALRTFKGTWRRAEHVRTTESGAEVYDDYAHHPTAIRQTIQGFRNMFPGKVINVIFQPHLFSRTKTLFDEFTQSFQDADHAYILPIYPAREAFDPTISSEMLVESASAYSPHISFVSSLDDARNLIESGNHDDIWITMGAGDVTEVGRVL